MQKEEILSRLDKRNFFKTFLTDLKEDRRGQGKACCPFHPDKTPSLSIDLQRGLFNCFGCGAKGDVFTFLQKLKGIDFVTALEEVGKIAGVSSNSRNGNSEVVATYRYEDTEGTVLYSKERVEPGRNGREKEFFFKHLEGNKWAKGRGNGPVPYNLPLMVGVRDIIVVEGEGKVELLREWGLVATCLDSGSNSPWRDDYLPYFKGKENIIILPDNDDPGRAYSEKIANALHGNVGKVKIVELPGLEEKGDIVDWQRNEGTKELLVQLIKTTPVWNPPEENNGKDGVGINSLNSINSHANSWPNLAPEALHGLAGDVVRTIEPHSEADPVALLVSLLVSFGNSVGSNPHFMVEADRHPMKIFANCVGETSKGRKGTSWGHIERLFRAVDSEWANGHVLSGLSSGEGLIWAVRDPIERKEPIKEKKLIVDYQTIVVDEGIDDKRLLVLESEFASVLRVIGRDGNTLSAVIRQAWDRGNLRTLTKNSPAKATGTHISILGHITKDELLRYLNNTEAGNGFGNRFLWVCVRRSKALPEGGGHIDLDTLITRLREAVEFAKAAEEIRKDSEARGIWREVYPSLSDGKPGLFGALTSRAEAQTMRLACLYALLDSSSLICKEHLLAALALWEYSEASVRYIFGDTTGDPVADRIIEALRHSPEGFSRSEIYNLSGRHTKADRIDTAIGLLLTRGMIELERRLTEGAKRPTEFLHLKGVRNYGN